MKYLIMIQSNPQSRAAWETWTEQQQMDFGRAHYALSDELAAAGLLVASEGLGDPALSTHVQVRQGQTLTTDGPFAEAKEFLAGFWIVEVDSSERAYELAAMISTAPGPGGTPMGIPIEVREVMSGPPKDTCP